MKPNSSLKGEIGQLKIEIRAAEKGFLVSRPSVGSANYDIVLDDGKLLYKAQIKYCNCFKGKNTLQLKLGGCTMNRDYYTKDDFDLLLVYLPINDKILMYNSDSFHKRSLIHINLKDKTSVNYWEKFIW